ncbi:BAH [Musa troglodytarum]|uniref:BAH n=1 Tax=Musa troglodytarum TaxID=320322 RepID=A0A9E7FMD6_9LILI|nr:BAH [Musa troglodytarum]
MNWNGDGVLMRPAELDKMPYMARGGGSTARRCHGARELVLPDHYGGQSRASAPSRAKCVVHIGNENGGLDLAGVRDFFCRFECITAAAGFTTTSSAGDDRSCHKCKMPNNPDVAMAQCKEFRDW